MLHTILDVALILLTILAFVGWRHTNRAAKANLETIVLLRDEIEQQRYGDHYYCLNCGHDCPSAAACVRNAYGHQREGDFVEPCRRCVTEYAARQMRAWLAQREPEGVNSERIV